MIEITLGELKNITEILNTIISTPLPAKVAYNLSKIVDPIDAELKALENFRADKIKQYGVTNEAGDITVTPENLPTFHAEMNELLESTVTLNVQPIKIEDFPETLTISAIQLHALNKIII